VVLQLARRNKAGDFRHEKRGKFRRIQTSFRNFQGFQQRKKRGEVQRHFTAQERVVRLESHGLYQRMHC